MSYTIEYNEKGFILFTIDRNEKRNAINYEVMEGLSKVITLAMAPDIKALVITGSGEQAFCSGGDLSVFHLLETKEEAYRMLSRMSHILYSLLSLPKPTMALLNGTAIGGGCEIAAACDFRIAKKGVKAGFVQGKQAITTGWGGGSILTEKMLPNMAMKLLMEAEVYPVDILKDIGFIDDIYEGSSLDACESFLEKILSNAAIVTGSYKKLWVTKWEQARLRERMEIEVQNCAVLWESDAHHEHVKSFINKKTENNN